MRTKSTYARQFLEKIRAQAVEAHKLAFDPRHSPEQRAGYKSLHAILSVVVDGLQTAIHLDEGER